MRRRFEIAIGKIKAKVPPEKGSLSYFPFVGKEYEGKENLSSEF
jgi:hypothetical protein